MEENTSEQKNLDLMIVTSEEKNIKNDEKGISEEGNSNSPKGKEVVDEKKDKLKETSQKIFDNIKEEVKEMSEDILEKKFRKFIKYLFEMFDQSSKFTFPDGKLLFKKITTKTTERNNPIIQAAKEFKSECNNELTTIEEIYQPFFEFFEKHYNNFMKGFNDKKNPWLITETGLKISFNDKAYINVSSFYLKLSEVELELSKLREKLPEEKRESIPIQVEEIWPLYLKYYLYNLFSVYLDSKLQQEKSYKMKKDPLTEESKLSKDYKFINNQIECMKESLQTEDEDNAEEMNDDTLIKVVRSITNTIKKSSDNPEMNETADKVSKLIESEQLMKVLNKLKSGKAEDVESLNVELANVFAENSEMRNLVLDMMPSNVKGDMDVEALKERLAKGEKIIDSRGNSIIDIREQERRKNTFIGFIGTFINGDNKKDVIKDFNEEKFDKYMNMNTFQQIAEYIKLSKDEKKQILVETFAKY